MQPSTQPDLFDVRPPDPKFKEPVARKTDPNTSHQAAFDSRRFSHGNRLLALQLLNQSGAMTDYELAELSGLQQNSIGKRRGECVQAGLVEKLLDNDNKIRKRPAPSGSMATVWMITDDGRRFLKNRGLT